MIPDLSSARLFFKGYMSSLRALPEPLSVILASDDVLTVVWDNTGVQDSLTY